MFHHEADALDDIRPFKPDLIAVALLQLDAACIMAFIAVICTAYGVRVTADAVFILEELDTLTHIVMR